MAVTVTALGKIQAAASAASANTTLTAGIAVGDLVIVNASGNSGGTTFSSFSDGVNTYTKSTEAAGGSYGGNSAMFWTLATGTVASGATVTITSAAARFHAATITKVTSPTGWLTPPEDAQAATAPTPTSPSMSTAATSSTSQSTEFIWAGFASSAAAPTFTVGTGFTADPNGSAASTTTVRVVWSEYQEIVDVVGPKYATATQSANSSFTGIVVAFRINATAADSTSKPGRAGTFDVDLNPLGWF